MIKMKWIEVALDTSSEEIDNLCLRLDEFGVEGISIEDEADFQNFLENNRQYWDYVDDELSARYSGLSRVKFYLPDDESGTELLSKIKKELDRPVTVAHVDSEDWENSWREYYKPIRIGKRLLIVPDWLEPDTDERTVLRLEPGLAFGTGGHATTQMCLEVLDGLELEGKNVLDLGCGSGILGIGALVLGCESVTACDVDPLAPKAAQDNAVRNGIETTKYRALVGDILADTALRQRIGGGYDVVLANIVSDVIIPLSAFVRQFMAEKGMLICSGIIDSRADEVKSALIENGFTITKEMQKEEWFCFVCK